MASDDSILNEKTLRKIEDMLQEEYRSNQDFNEALNRDLSCTFKGLGDPAADYEYQPSEVLFWADRSAYLDEKARWDAKAKNELSADLTKLLRNAELSTSIHQLARQIRRRRIAAFVGAGMSKACGFPLWTEALSELREKIDIGKTTSTDPLVLADALYHKDQVKMDNYIASRFDLRAGVNDRATISGAVKILPQICHGCVITTNFDRVLEEAFLQASKPFEGYMHGLQQAHNFLPSLISGDRCILKLHGTVGAAESYVMSKKQYASAYGSPFNFKLPLPRSLRQIYISNSLLFVGCSLEQDWTLKLFGVVRDSALFEIPQHFAILEAPKAAAQRTKKETNPLASHRLRQLRAKKVLAFAWRRATRHGYEKESQTTKANEVDVHHSAPDLQLDSQSFGAQAGPGDPRGRGGTNLQAVESYCISTLRSVDA